MTVIVAPWMQTASGGAFDLLDPSVGQVRIYDIARSLSRIARFTGHTKGIGHGWSVAEHSVLVSKLLEDTYTVSRDACLLALLHDAPEAYIGDNISPMKAALDVLSGGAFKGYFETLETLVYSTILRRFCLSPATAEEKRLIVHCDMVALALEKRDLMEGEPREWVELPEPPKSFPKLRPSGPSYAFQAFVARLSELATPHINKLMDMEETPKW